MIAALSARKSTAAWLLCAMSLAGCSTHYVAAPRPIQQPRVARSLAVTVIDQRP